MTDTEDEIVVEVDEDLFEQGADGKTKPATGDPKNELKEQFKELQSETERERTRAADAERRAAAATQEAVQARKEASDARGEAIESQYGNVASGLEAAQAEAATAEQEYKAAFEAGDGGAMAKAQRKMARAESKIVTLEEAKADLETRKPATGERKPEPTTRAAEPAADPVEAYISNRTEPTANWLRSHKEWITDPRKNAKLTAAHHDAVAEGLQPDTKEYFEHVEVFTGIKKNGAANGAERAQNGQFKPARRASVPVAPVQASSGGTNGGTEVRLTRGEAAAATDGTHTWNYDDPSGQKRFKKGDAIGIQEMARRKLELTKQGAYDRSYTEQ